MFKKILLAAAGICLSTSAMATELTNPFYLLEYAMIASP